MALRITSGYQRDVPQYIAVGKQNSLGGGEGTMNVPKYSKLNIQGFH